MHFPFRILTLVNFNIIWLERFWKDKNPKKMTWPWPYQHVETKPRLDVHKKHGTSRPFQPPQAQLGNLPSHQNSKVKKVRGWFFLRLVGRLVGFWLVVIWCSCFQTWRFLCFFASFGVQVLSQFASATKQYRPQLVEVPLGPSNGGKRVG